MPPKKTQSDEYLDVVLKSPKEIVHLEYTPSQLPPKLSNEWTRFVCISDTHSRTFEVPSGEVLLHSGDLTNTGTVRDFEKTMEWLYSLPHKIKIIIAGNHDLALHTEWYEHHANQRKSIGELRTGPRAKEAGIVYLQDEEYQFQVTDNGRVWSVYGSPWSPAFYDLAFNYPREEAHEFVSKFPKTDILLTHGPPSQILDRTLSGIDVGCEALRERLPALRPRLHLFGHIHEAHGAYIHTWNPGLDNAPPIVQNTDPDASPASVDRPGVTDAAASTEPTETALDKTVFVNAANQPMGKKAYRPGGKAKFGGPGFQAVVVDLMD